MKKKLCLLMFIIISLCFSVNSFAILVLSGDGNITDNLITNTYDNDKFFQNVLGGGSNVLVLRDLDVSFDSNVNDFYNDLTGITSTLFSGSLTASILSEVDLFVATTPNDAFTTYELNALSDFYTGGGSIFFLGENAHWDSTANQYINDALTFLGSSMSIIADSTFDSSYHLATGDHITIDALTSGVSQFQYGGSNEILVNGGIGLFSGVDNQYFVAYEDAPVPEPATFLLLGGGLAGLAFYRRKKK